MTVARITRLTGTLVYLLRIRPARNSETVGPADT